LLVGEKPKFFLKNSMEVVLFEMELADLTRIEEIHPMNAGGR